MIKTLLVGFGFSGQTFHLPFLTQLSGYHLCGVVSSKPEAVHAVLPDVPVFASLDDALAQAQPELSIITTPNDLHYAQASQCLASDSHVLVEKPFTLSHADATALCEQAERQQKTLHVFHNRRFDGDFLTLKKLMAEHRFGDVKRMISRFDRFRPVPKNRWRENAGPGAGIFWDLGPHLLDQCVQLFGLPEALQANVQILRDQGQSDDLFDVTLFYTDKVVQVGSSPFQGGTTLRFDVQGTSGNYRKYGLDPQENQLKAGMPLTAKEFGYESKKSFGKFCFETGCDLIETEKGNYSQFYQQLADSIEHQQPSPAAAESVVPVIQLIELALQSSAQGKRLAVKLPAHKHC
ncbi:Gfo/Idh/MocA family oxidoreductase [Salinimonas marina]|uniref:Gfo/Idh/MocA family oxidoreductase n=1 Tax=Salinimonas marina TaxID=2785918 RepID=A0A7S9HCU3_9ALTE|nr:Gfo/Idh/MocA family oxidoreductase [Salinimonas marina]QPG05525.1 Gfo/Idh/MocA family oxidoreductase [Salinimonas marina]